MRILVTGGAGFIGRHLGPELRRAGHDVRVLDLQRPSGGSRPDPGFRFTRGSVLDPALVDRLIAGADLVIHLAAIAEPAEYGRRPKATMDTNILGSLHVAASAARHSVPVLFASSSEVYGLNPNLPWREDARSVFGSVEDVRWCYAASKLAAEHYHHA